MNTNLQRLLQLQHVLQFINIEEVEKKQKKENQRNPKNKIIIKIFIKILNTLIIV
jgi:hypothetical protein